MGEIERKPADIQTPQEIRQNILGFEQALAQFPGAFFGDSAMCPLKHSFTDGMYVREIHIPRGFVLTGKIHKHSHPNFLLEGEVVVVTEGEGLEHLVAPMSIISKAGTKRVVIALEDTVWVTVHLNPEGHTDLDRLEEEIIAKDYDAFELEQAKKQALLGENAS
jgi:hypothetical protein